jgi:RNA polymerase sigma-70 factor (sigma-E family)
MEADPSDVIRSPGSWPERAGYDPAAQMTVNPAEYVTELFRAHHLELVRLAVLIVGDLATAEDVVQDAFEQLHRRWRTLRKQSSALEYARSAVLNGSRSVLRRRSVARRHAARISASGHQDADAAVGFEQRSELIEAFRRLPARQREVLALRYYVDMSVADAAATLHISEGAVRSTASRGLDALSSPNCSRRSRSPPGGPVGVRACSRSRPRLR